MTVGRIYFGLAVFRGQLWAVGGRDEDDETLSSCEYLDVATNTWVAGPPMTTPRSFHGLAVLNGQLWAVGGYCSSAELWAVGDCRTFSSCEYLDSLAISWIVGPDLTLPLFPPHGPRFPSAPM